MEQDRKSSDSLNNAVSFLSKNMLRTALRGPGLPLFITIGSLFFFTTIIMVFFLGEGGLAGGISTEAPQATSQAPQNIGDVINITGATPSEAQVISDALSQVLQYPLFKQYFSNGGIVDIVFVPNLTWEGENVHAVVRRSDTIELRSNLPTDILRYAFLHETGHIILLRNSISFPLSRLISEDGSSCYSPLGYLRSYPFADGGGGGSSQAESFSESISKLLIRESPYRKGVLTDFQKECPNTYRWFSENIFSERVPSSQTIR